MEKDERDVNKGRDERNLSFFKVCIFLESHYLFFLLIKVVNVLTFNLSPLA